jgi:CheY-like chemotaxis protein
MGPRRAAILVLDDDGEMGAWLVDLLTDEGYLAEACQQGPAALAALAQRHPDLLLADMVLDGMPGLEVLCQAKQQDPALAVKPGQRILSTSAEIADCMRHGDGGALYASRTSSKSHNCCMGLGRCPKCLVDLGR